MLNENYIKNFNKLSGVLNENFTESSNMGGASDIKKMMYFTMNYNHNFIDEVWADDPHMLQHLKPKFDSAYSTYGSRGVIIAFYLGLDSENQRKFENYVINTYNP